MDDYLRNFAVALPLLVPLDFLWFGALMKGVYLTELGSHARMKDGKFTPLLGPGLMAWLLIALGIVLFAVPRLSPDDSVLQPLKWGALLGAVTYGIYDLTNLTTLRDWSPKLTLIDWAWGTCLTAIITTVVWLVAK